MPQKFVIFSEEEWEKFPKIVIDEIIKLSKKDYGIHFLSRDTGEELEDLAVRGFIFSCFDNIINKIMKK